MNSNQNIFFFVFNFQFSAKEAVHKRSVKLYFKKKITSYNNNNKQIKRERNLQGIS